MCIFTESSEQSCKIGTSTVDVYTGSSWGVEGCPQVVEAARKRILTCVAQLHNTSLTSVLQSLGLSIGDLDSVPQFPLKYLPQKAAMLTFQC